MIVNPFLLAGGYRNLQLPAALVLATALSNVVSNVPHSRAAQIAGSMPASPVSMIENRR
jgi:hypothetical protein